METTKQQLVQDIVRDFTFAAMVWHEVYELTKNKIFQDILNKHIQISTYGKGVTGIDFVHIAVKPTNKIHEEFRGYEKATKRLVFNLKLDYDKIVKGTRQEAIKAMALLFLNAIKLSIKFKIEDYNGEQLYKDVKALFIAQNWIVDKDNTNKVI